jgi:hypothetical protein
MNCDEVKESLSEHIDGMLPDAESSMIGEHLERCSACRELYETMSRIRSHMRLTEPVDEPEQFAESVQERLKRRFSPARTLRRLFTPLHIKLPIGAAAVAALALLVVYTLLIRDEGSVYEITVSLVPSADRGVVEDRSPKKGGEGDRGKGEVAERGTSFETLIESLGGRVIESDYAEGSEIPSSLTIEIKPVDYSTMLARLSRFGVVEEPYYGIAEENGEPIRVRIFFLQYTGENPESYR